MSVETEKLALRPLVSDDISMVERWLNTDHVLRWFGDPAGWLKEIRDEQNTYEWITHFIVEYKGRAIGFAQYYECAKFTDGDGRPWDNEPPETYGIDFMIGDQSMLGQGLGRSFVKLISERACSEGGASFLIADPEPENDLSIKVLKANGFKLDEKTGLYKFQCE